MTVAPLGVRWLCLCVALAGCGGGDSLVGAQPRPGVTLRVPVDVTLFAEGVSLQVRVWNREQLATVERNSRCSTAYDPTGAAQEVRCPEGITFQPVKPEEFEFPVHAIAGSVAVKSATVRVGERFRILLSGKSRDGCNTTSADRVGSAEAADLVVGSLNWGTTARACAGG